MFGYIAFKDVLEFCWLRTQHWTLVVNDKKVFGTPDGWNVGEKTEMTGESEPTWVQNPTAIDQDHLRYEFRSCLSQGNDERHQGLDFSEGKVTRDIWKGQLDLGVVHIYYLKDKIKRPKRATSGKNIRTTFQKKTKDACLSLAHLEVWVREDDQGRDCIFIVTNNKAEIDAANVL